MKVFSRIARAAMLAFAFTAMLAPASAMDRVTWYFSENPPSPWLNQWERDTRLGVGQGFFDDFGSASGFFTNACVVPATGLNITIQPCSSNTLASLYQYLPEEATGWGGGTYGPSTALAADNTQVDLQALLTNSGAITIGPLNGPGTAGWSIIYAIECKVNTLDTTSQTQNFVSATGTVTSLSVNRDRVDQWFCQSKAGTAALSPTAPTIDSGYLGVALVTVANGASSITTGNIVTTTANQFFGFARVGSSLSASLPTCTDASSRLTTSGCSIPASIVTGSLPASQISGSLPASQISGTLGVGNGGTGATTIAGAGLSQVLGLTGSAITSSTLHFALGAASLSLIQNACGASQSCNGGTVTLTGSSVFTNSSTYACSVTYVSASPSFVGAATNTYSANAVSGTQFSITMMNGQTSSQPSAGASTVTVTVFCLGT